MNSYFIDILNAKKTTIFLVLILLILISFIAWSTISHYEGYKTADSISRQKKLLNQKNPLLKYLPYRNDTFSISYDKTDDNSLNLKIFTKSPIYRYQAIKYILGIDKDATIKYKINFVDYKSPLDNSAESKNE